MLSLLDLVLTGLAAALWYVWPELGAWPLLLVATGIATGMFSQPPLAVWRRSRFDPPLTLFLVSALLGAGIAYAQELAWAKLWTIVGGLALYGSVARAAERARVGRWEVAPVSFVLALFPVVLGGYFFMTNDWGRWAGKLPWLDPITAWLASWQPALPGHRLHPNVVGGLLAGLIPLQAAAVRGTRGGWGLVGFSLLALLLTASRGAWLSLAIVTAGWVAWRFWSYRKLKRNGRRQAGGGSRPRATLLWLVIAIAAVLTTLPWMLLVSGLVSPTSERIVLLRDSLALALDTPFTGLGLAGFQMAFSSYVLLLHVGHTFHSHNLLLDIWIEQGMLGLIAWGWLLGVAISMIRTGQAQVDRAATKDSLESTFLLKAAALASLAAILLHGLVDDAFYGSRGVLLLFLPFAVLTRMCRSHTPAADRRSQRRLVSWVGVALTVPLALALLPATRAAVQANLGALSQTRAELSVYRWPEWPIQDALRRQIPDGPPPVDLTAAIAHYRAALALNQSNTTANRRLGQIELAQGDFQAARSHLEAAYAAAPWQRAVRQLLAEAYTVTGEAQQAAALWRTVDASQGQLELRRWWYNVIGEMERAQSFPPNIKD